MIDQNQPAQTPAEDRERTPLVRLARQNTPSAALTRIVTTAAPESGPGRVAVAAFNSSV